MDAGKRPGQTGQEAQKMTRTYYGPANADGLRIRYWYDRSLRLWTANVVTGGDDCADQVSDSMYELDRKDLTLDVSAYSYLMHR
jgi:hypothetical protein